MKKINAAFDRAEKIIAAAAVERAEMLKLLHLYAYPGDFEGRPTKEEIDKRARDLIDRCIR